MAESGATLRTIATAWAFLLALMLASLGSAYLKLGAFNMVAGLAIAAVKSAIVVWWFMRMRQSGPLVRLTGLVGLGVWAILVGLSGVDYLTRVTTSAEVQRPQQLLPPQTCARRLEEFVREKPLAASRDVSHPALSVPPCAASTPR